MGFMFGMEESVSDGCEVLGKSSEATVDQRVRDIIVGISDFF